MAKSSFSPAQLKDWRLGLGLTQAEAAAALGVSLRGYQRWEGGERRLPGMLPLACAALAMGLHFG